MNDKAPEAPAAAALRERNGEANPKRRKVAIAATAVGAVLLAVGGFVGVNALNDYRADIAASEQAAAEYYEAAAYQSELAQAAAAEAQDAADAAGQSVTALEAAEAEAAAIAEAAAAAAAAQAAKNVNSGLTAEGKCPAGTAPGQINADGTEGLCAPTGPGGATCAEYDGPTCTSWLKP